MCVPISLLQVLSKDDPPHKTYVYKLDVPVTAQWISLAVAPFEILPDAHVGLISHMCLSANLPKLRNTVEFFHNAFKCVIKFSGFFFSNLFDTLMRFLKTWATLFLDCAMYFQQPLWRIPWCKISIWVIHTSFLSSWNGSILIKFGCFHEHLQFTSFIWWEGYWSGLLIH